jgi:hypothetical protein
MRNLSRGWFCSCRCWARCFASTRHAPLDQINADNLSAPEVAWRFKPDMLESRRDVVAIDPSKGEMLRLYGIAGGHQYLVVATGGGNVSAELLAFKLPRA